MRTFIATRTAAWIRLEGRACLSLNQLCDHRIWGRVAVIASRLGDGSIWAALALFLLLVHGDLAATTCARMMVCATINLIIYKAMKTITARPRPCDSSLPVHCILAPPDYYSFPSGHTLHAVCFTVIAVEFAPWLGWILIPFASLVAWSRIVLGLHYPTDIGAGAIIGALMAAAGIHYL